MIKEWINQRRKIKLLKVYIGLLNCMALEAHTINNLNDKVNNILKSI